MAKSKLKQINAQNELIKNLDNTEYIQNPIIYSQICGNFSLMQTNIMLALICSIKDRIQGSIVEGKGIVGPMFSKDETKNKVTFNIPLTSLGIDSNQYGDLYEAGKAMLKLDTSYKYTNEEGEKRIRVENIFHAFEMPEEDDKNGKKRRKGYIELEMDGDIVDRIFNNSNQYIEHIADIAKICRSPRTPRLYIYLSAWKRMRTVTLSYDAVKEYLGALEYSKDHTRILNDRYPTYALFHRDVIDVAKKELKKLADNGKVEFYFDYEPIYPMGKKRGNPEKILFKLISANEQEIDAEEIVEEAEQREVSKVDVNTMKVLEAFERAYRNRDDKDAIEEMQRRGMRVPRNDDEWKEKAKMYGIER